MTVRLLRALVMGTAVLILAGCAGQAETAREDDKPPVEQSTKATEWSGAPAEATATSTLVSGAVPGFPGLSGYTFDVAFTLMSITATSDVTNAVPGESNVSWLAPMTVFATNTADQRTSDWANLQNLSISALWPAGSPLCGSDVRNADGSGTPFIIRAVVGTNYCTALLRTLAGLDGGFAIAETAAVTADRPIEIVVAEQNAELVTQQLTAGPTAWIISTGDLTTCGEGIRWVSAPEIGCTGLGVIGAYPQSIDVRAAASNLETFNAELEELGDAAPQSLSCPFGGFATYLPGLFATSVRAYEWTDAFANWNSGGARNGVMCNSGGMQTGAVLYGDVAPDEYLAGSQGWEQISPAIVLAEGNAYLAPDTVVPEGGDSYDVMKFAWAKDGVMVLGRVVRADASSTLFWLGQNLPSLTTSLAAWGRE